MLETIRTACLCLKFAASADNVTNNKKSSTVRGRDSEDHKVEMNGHCPETIERNDADWKDNRESCSDDDDDDEDDYIDDSDHDAGMKLSHKDLFRMATLGGATGILSYIRIKEKLTVRNALE